jgi:hypothetical protein
LAVLVYLPLGPLDGSHLPICNCGDNAMAAAFLEWTPWALLHGHNPLLTNYQYFPSGANLAANTSMPLLGILLSPVILTAGPVAALNLLLRLAFAASASSAFLVLRRLGARPGSAFVGGLVFGFSPYMLGHGESHANLVFVPLLPVIALLVAEILVIRRRSPRRAGLWLGLVAALQYGISSELLADAAVVVAVTVVIVAIKYRDQATRHAGHAARAGAWSLVAFLPLTAYPIYLSLFGPNHPNGPPRATGVLAALNSDLLGAIVPTTRQLLSLGHLGVIGDGYVSGNLLENGVYLGLPLVAAGVVLAVRYRRDARLGWAATIASIAYVLSLGAKLRVAGHGTPIPLPEALLAHLPLLDGLVVVRFFVFGYLAIAFLIAFGLEHAWDDARAAGHKHLAALAGITVVVLAPLFPQLPYPHLQGGSAPYDSYAIPSFFTGNDEQVVPAASPVLVYPFSDPSATAGYVNYPVLWQAVGRERFAILDGDATRPGPEGFGTESGPPMVPGELETMLLDAYFGPYAYYGTLSLQTGPFPSLDASVLEQLRAGLSRYEVSTVIVDPVGEDPDAFVDAIDAALGASPVRLGGVLVWENVPRDLAAEGG